MEQTLAPETQLGGYRIGALVSAVAGRAVYRGTDAVSGRAVRIETFPAHAFRSDTEREGYKSAVLETAALHHPVLLPVTEVGDQVGLVFLVSHDVPTHSLAEVIGRARRLGYLRAARIVNRVGEALDVLHRRGITHGAVMPSNVLLDRRDGVVLAGVGQPPAPGDGFGLPAGMLDYAAPERLSGAVPHATAEQDLYALGCVLYSAATGYPPFVEHLSSEAKTQAHLSEWAVPPSRRVVGLTSDCDAVIARALAKDPRERFDSGHELGTAALGAAKGRLVTHWERTMAAGATAPTTLVLDVANGKSAIVPEAEVAPDVSDEQATSVRDVPLATDPEAEAERDATTVSDTPTEDTPAEAYDDARTVSDTPTEAYESAAPVDAPDPDATRFREVVPEAEADRDATTVSDVPAAAEPAEAQADEATAAAAQADEDTEVEAASDTTTVSDVPADEATEAEAGLGATTVTEVPAEAEEAEAAPAEADDAHVAPRELGAFFADSGDWPTRRRRSRSRALLRVGAALIGVAALAGALAAGGVFDGGSGGSKTNGNAASTPPPAQPQTSTPAPAPSTKSPAPEPKAPTRKPSKQAALRPWPAGRDAYTVVVFVTTSDRAHAQSAARRASGIVQPAGILESSAHPPLPPGHIVAYAGRFNSQAAALRAAERVRAAGVAGNPYVRRIRG